LSPCIETIYPTLLGFGGIQGNYSLLQEQQFIYTLNTKLQIHSAHNSYLQ